MSTISRFQGGNPYVRETTKVSEIKDRFGNTRFKVALTDFDDTALQNDNLNYFDWEYQVTVVSYCYAEDPITVVCRDFDLYENAIRFFNGMVKQYSYLVQAETRDVQDIRIYAERTGYHKICPNCCATCRWAKPCDKNNSLFKDWKANLRGKFVCMNADLYAPPKRDLEPDCGQHDYYHNYSEERLHVIDIHPIVDAYGLCNGFERRTDEKYRDPTHSEWRFRNHDMAPADCDCSDDECSGSGCGCVSENQAETIAKYAAREQYAGAKEDITRTVGEAIEQQMQKNMPIIEGNKNNSEAFDNNSEVFDGGGAD